MTNRKPCIRCGRSIDEFAKTCPFCNWDQTVTPPTPEETAAQAYAPPEKKVWQNKIVGAAAFVALVIVAFVVGTLIHGFEPGEVKAAQSKSETTATSTATFKAAPRSNVTLVPVSGSEGLAPIEQPITSAPAQTPGQQANDATALPENEYAAAAARAKAQQEAEAKAKATMIDPRSLTGNPYNASERTETLPKRDMPMPSVRPKETSRASVPEEPESAPTTVRTPAILESRPLPHIAADHDMTARLNLTVAPDGHVTDVDISDPVPNMSQVIAAVQRWHFKPATENGEPVTSRVSVDITFHANE